MNHPNLVVNGVCAEANRQKGSRGADAKLTPGSGEAKTKKKVGDDMAAPYTSVREWASYTREWYRGTTVLVTGAGRGIGAAIAEAFYLAGADVLAVYRTEHVDMAPESGAGSVTWIARDLFPAQALYEWVQALEQDYGPIHVLVNNAGTQWRQPAAEFPLEKWQYVLNVNLDAVFILCQAVGRGMLARGRGHIINVASINSFQGGWTIPAYAAAKGAVAQLTKALANEWAGQGVHVNAIAPGYIVTDLTEALQNDPHRQKEILSRTPAQRWGQPDDVAGAALFLASPMANFIHGHLLVADGGWLGR